MKSPDTLVHGPAHDRAPLQVAPHTAARRRISVAHNGPRPPSEVAPLIEPGALLLGRYRLAERLGAGGFGEVWRAHDELLHRQVAVKRIRLGPAGDGERAEREALATARLAHPAIVALYEACAQGDAFYLISELIHGSTLAELIREDALDDEQVLDIGVALAAALGHAHARGVIHRDIKPHNVLVPARIEDSAGAAKLTDFGGASLIGEDALTRPGDVLGTLAYMAPEQSDGSEVGAEADLYSLALLLYEAFTGANPVRGATPAATARRIGRRVEPLQRARGDLPRGLARAIDRALLPAPEQRGTVRGLADALLAARASIAVPARRQRSPLAPRLREWTGLGPLPAPGPEPGEDGQVHGAHASDGHGYDPARGEQPGAPDLPGAWEPVAAADGGDGAPRSGFPGLRALRVSRRTWIALGAAAVAWQAVTGRPGVALLCLAALAPLLALPRHGGPGWLAGLLAPALGVLGLAGAYPALAGQAQRWRARLLAGALGYWWLTLAEPLLARRLWFGVRPGTPARGVWEPSPGSTAAHVVGPLLSMPVLLGAALWALGAVALPWIVRGRRAALDVVAVTTWSALLASASALAAPQSSVAAQAAPRGLVLGAVLGAIMAVAMRAVRGPVRPNRA